MRNERLDDDLGRGASWVTRKQLVAGRRQWLSEVGGVFVSGRRRGRVELALLSPYAGIVTLLSRVHLDERVEGAVAMGEVTGVIVCRGWRGVDIRMRIM